MDDGLRLVAVNQEGRVVPCWEAACDVLQGLLAMLSGVPSRSASLSDVCGFEAGTTFELRGIQLIP